MDFFCSGSREQRTLCREHANRNTVHARSSLLMSWISESGVLTKWDMQNMQSGGGAPCSLLSWLVLVLWTLVAQWHCIQLTGLQGLQEVLSLPVWAADGAPSSKQRCLRDRQRYKLRQWDYQVEMIDRAVYRLHSSGRRSHAFMIQ